MSSKDRAPLRRPAALAELGERVRQRRLELGLSQTECAKEQSFSQAFLSMVELGQRNPTFSTVLDLADALDMDAADLVAGLGAHTK
jgi:transcriptional regulator with XRE-family HTH domain